MLVLTSCRAVADILPGQPAQCQAVTDCVAKVPECRQSLACENNQCVFRDAMDGSLLPEQQAGDCVQVVCDGKGGSKVVPIAEDAPDDGNPCTKDACIGTTPTHEMQAQAPCYTGDPWTPGRGICKKGVVDCSTGKPTGQCKGEVLPGVEVCNGLLLDEDCDGQVNEDGDGCHCKPGALEACYTGPTASQGVGVCHGGMRGCTADGLGFGPCVGDRTPSAEVCDAEGKDEDCDGKINEEGNDCYCGDGFVSVGEECDDGNADSSDMCTTQCTMARCGDGFVQPGLGEICDDGNLISTDTCTEACIPGACGDGFYQAVLGEECDDGNLLNGDACSAGCERRIVQVVSFGFSNCVLLREGTVKCWGNNEAGRLGLGDTENRGDDPDEMGAALPAVDLGTNAVVEKLVPGGAILQGGILKRWGYNGGSLGLGDTNHRGDEPGEMGDALPPVDLGTEQKVVGSDGGCAWLLNGNIKCWGLNWYGRLGLGSSNTNLILGDEPGEMGDALLPVALGTGASVIKAEHSVHECVLLAGGKIKCWGWNDTGQLGLGDTISRGVLPGQMGDALPTVDLGSGKEVADFDAGSGYTCALLTDGTVKCWGNGGNLGLGDTQSRGDEPGEMGDALPTINFGIGAKPISLTVGETHACVVLQDGRIKCWGSNYGGVLGINVAEWIVVGSAPGQMGDALQSVDLGTGTRAIAVTAGPNCTCALLWDGNLKCWGYNESGQLGLGDTKDRGINPQYMGDNLPNVSLW